jgi:hypothetical protein
MKFTFSATESLVRGAVDDITYRMRQASRGAIQDTADEMVKQGRANIAAAGFPVEKWQLGLKSKFYPNEGLDAAAIVYHKINFAGVFETGVTIAGNPLLWVKIRENLPRDVHSPKQYHRPMVSVNVPGKAPLLFDKFDRARGPLFVGVRSVTLGKRFDLYRIFERVAEQMQKFYDQRFKAD